VKRLVEAVANQSSRAGLMSCSKAELKRARNQNRKVLASAFVNKVEEELSRLERTIGLGHELSVRWVPNRGFDKHGEVRDKVIYVYDVGLDEALETLRHEFIDYCISVEVVEPLVSLINLQKAMIENLTYRRKETLVDRFARII